MIKVFHTKRHGYQYGCLELSSLLRMAHTGVHCKICTNGQLAEYRACFLRIWECPESGRVTLEGVDDAEKMVS